MMNKQKGNMYDWVTHTWNPIRGKCPHECSYCYMKRFKVRELRFVEKELKQNLGKGNVIFVGSSTDMFAQEVSSDWIINVLEHCAKFDNTYLFQSKNPQRFQDFSFPDKSFFGTTIETNRITNVSKAPPPTERQYWIGEMPNRMVSIEPVMDFDLDVMSNWLKDINPVFVSIGADSQRHGLEEPSAEKIKALITGLREFTEVRVKKNLKRLTIEKGCEYCGRYESECKCP